MTAGGEVLTPFGKVAGNGSPPGSAVDVLIRYHAIAVDEGAGGGVAAVIRSVLPYGRGSLVRLEVEGDDGPVFVRGRLPRTDLPAPGSQVMLTLNPAHVFVFPVDS